MNHGIALFVSAAVSIIAFADAGHAPAAEVALVMFHNGPALFGRDWDTTQAQLTAWAAQTGRSAPVLQPHIDPRTVVAVTRASR
jgi:hypothetical protein